MVRPLTGYLCGIVLPDHSDHPWSYALHRLIETVLGVGVAILVGLVPKLIPTDKPKRQNPQGSKRLLAQRYSESFSGRPMPYAMLTFDPQSPFLKHRP